MKLWHRPGSEARHASSPDKARVLEATVFAQVLGVEASADRRSWGILCHRHTSVFPESPPPSGGGPLRGRRGHAHPIRIGRGPVASPPHP
jgi:hypothetical protein